MKMHIFSFVFLVMSCGVRNSTTSTPSQSKDDVYAAPAASLRTGRSEGGPRLIRIYFNPYTDSIKPVLNYYVNVEGEFSDGTFQPLDTKSVRLWSDVGSVEGNEWLVRPPVTWKKVTFHAEALSDPSLKATITQYVMQGRSEEDERIMRGQQSDGR